MISEFVMNLGICLAAEDYGNGSSRAVERERTYAEPRGAYSARAPSERPSAAFGGGEGRPVGRAPRYAPY
jgi:hypothetical protein